METHTFTVYDIALDRACCKWWPFLLVWWNPEWGRKFSDGHSVCVCVCVLSSARIFLQLVKVKLQQKPKKLNTFHVPAFSLGNRIIKGLYRKENTFNRSILFVIMPYQMKADQSISCNKPMRATGSLSRARSLRLPPG